MFISVDLPAPFSPSRACTSPLRRSKSTWSSATTPGKRFVMPRISRTVDASTAQRILRRRGAPFAVKSVPERRGAGSSPAPRSREMRLRLRRQLELARDDLALDRVHLRDELLRHGRIDLAEAHAAVLERELQVLVALE